MRQVRVHTSLSEEERTLDRLFTSATPDAITETPSAWHSGVRDQHNEQRNAPPSSAGRRRTARVTAGITLAALVVTLGAVAKLPAIARWQQHVETQIATHARTPALTAIAHALTLLATPEIIGVAATVLIPLILLLRHRKMDAAVALGVLAGSLACAIVLKTVVDEPRPPSVLWALPADTTASYPSGHTTTAAAITVAIALTASTRRTRRALLTTGAAVTILVALARVYLGNHYPLDVIAGVLLALATGLAISAACPTSTRINQSG